MSLATVNSAPFLNGSQEQKKAVADQWVDSLRATGFARMTNTGIYSDVIRDAEVWVSGRPSLGPYIRSMKMRRWVFLALQSSRFFHQDPQKKVKVLNVPSPKPRRACSFKGAESTSRLGKLDLADNIFLTDEKEHYDVGPLHDRAHPNKWIEDDLPGFRDFTTSFYDHCQTLCLHNMAAFIKVSLGLAPGSLQERCKPASIELR